MIQPADFKLMLMTAENRVASFREVDPKTNTRRVIKMNNGKLPVGDFVHLSYDLGFPSSTSFIWAGFGNLNDPVYTKSSYQVGDIVGIREPYRIYSCGKDGTAKVEYLDDLTLSLIELSGSEYDQWQKRKYPYRNSSSLFMYKSLARKFYEIVEVRVERVQDISVCDVRAEGITDDGSGPCGLTERFMKLWNSINESRGYGWDKNPWVFVYVFKKWSKP